MTNNKVLTKVIFIGDASVGKTSLLNSFMTKEFSNNYRPTIGSDFMIKDFEVDGQTICVQLWDTAGQERFISLGVPFYRGANCCVIVFDVNLQKSFEMLDFWMEEFISSSSVELTKDFPFVVLGNKIDLKNKDKIFIEFEKADQWCRSRGNITYLEVSCFDQSSLLKAFQIIAAKSVVSYQSTKEKASNSQQLQLAPEEENDLVKVCKC